MAKISPNETIKPSFRFVFHCETRICLERTFKALGMDEMLKKIEERARIGIPVTIIFTDVTDYLCEDSCSASLVSYSEYNYEFGKVTIIDSRKEVYNCGPDAYYVSCPKYKLEKGAIVYHRVRGYTGDRDESSDTLYINPPKEVRVENGMLYIED